MLLPPHSALLCTPHHRRRAMAATIFQLLEALPAHFAGVAASPVAAERAYNAASEFVEMALHGPAAGLTGDQGRLER